MEVKFAVYTAIADLTAALRPPFEGEGRGGGGAKTPQLVAWAWGAPAASPPKGVQLKMNQIRKQESSVDPAIARAYRNEQRNDRVPKYTFGHETVRHGRYRHTKTQTNSTSQRPESNGRWPVPGFGQKTEGTNQQQFVAYPSILGNIN